MTANVEQPDRTVVSVSNVEQGWAYAWNLTLYPVATARTVPEAIGIAP